MARTRRAADTTQPARTRLTAAQLTREIVRQHFAIVATTGIDGQPDAAGVSYGATSEAGALVVYVMTRRHLRKARDIERDHRVSLVIPIRRRLLWFVPPATIQLSGRAELLPQDDPRGVALFQRFLLGRRITSSYEKMRADGDQRICFVRIAVDPIARSYMVGTTVWQVMRRMEAGAATTNLTGGSLSA